jgi:hypothetical protein
LGLMSCCVHFWHLSLGSKWTLSCFVECSSLFFAQSTAFFLTLIAYPYALFSSPSILTQWALEYRPKFWCEVLFFSGNVLAFVL